MRNKVSHVCQKPATEEPENAFNVQFNMKTQLKKVISCLFKLPEQRTIFKMHPKMSIHTVTVTIPSKTRERKSMNEAVGFPQDRQCHTESSNLCQRGAFPRGQGEET